MNRSETKGGMARVLFYNSLLLCAVAVIIRGVGVIFGVYVSNRVGAETMGLYSLIGSVWGFALTIATSGIGLAVSRTLARTMMAGGEVRCVMRSALSLAAFFGTLAAVLLLILAVPASEHWLREPRALLPLRCFALSLPAISLSSALSGYFTAVRRAYKNAGVQLFEQTVRICGVILLLTPFLPRGAEYACVALVLGGVAGEILSCILNGLLFLFDRRVFPPVELSRGDSRHMKRQLLGVALPVAFASYVRSGLTAVEHVLIPIGLEAFGASRADALADYGVLSGMVLPIVLFPYALIYSFTGLLVPELSGSSEAGEKARISYISTRIFRLTLIFGVGIAGALAVCSKELGNSLYGNATAGMYILTLAPLMPVMYLDTVTDSMLKGLGQQVYIMNVNIADAALSVILVRLLLPAYGVNGYIAVLYISELINFAFSVTRLIRLTAMRISVIRNVIMPLVCIIIGTRLSCLIFGITAALDAPGWLTLSFHIAFVIATYTALLRLLGPLDRETCLWLRGIILPRKKSTCVSNSSI